MRGKFWFGGRCSSDFGLIVSGSGTYGAPERDVERISIPGRSGELIRDNGRFKNIPVSYPVSICRDFPDYAAAARAWLLASPDYQRLEDEYHTDSFRMALFQGPIDFDVHFLNRAGEGKLVFSCKPQRYLKSGEFPIRFQSPGVLHNLYAFPALPLITVYGSGAGTLTVGDVTVEIKAMDGHIVFDSELQDAYRVADSEALENMNGNIKAPVFPELQPGDNAISWTGDITGIEIIPRWWTL